MIRVGVVDVGTNSVRVLVTDGEPGAEAARVPLREIERGLVITRLGEGVDRDRVLGVEPLRRTVAAIRDSVERCRAADAHRIRVIATSAVRDARNRDEFLAAVRAATGLGAEVLSGEEEARLGFAGATLSLSPGERCVVCDVGGGSTELVRGVAGGAVSGFVSLDIGSVRLTERHVRSDPPHGEELDAVRADAEAHLIEAARALGPGAPGETLVGLAGTITTVAAIDLGLTGYDRGAIHHSVLRRRRIAAIRARLAAMTSAERRALPAMPRGREDVIVAGVVILEAAMDRFAFDECLVSETDILDGAALDLLRSTVPAGESG